jgi:hypothetical protein
MPLGAGLLYTANQDIDNVPGCSKKGKRITKGSLEKLHKKGKHCSLNATCCACNIAAWIFFLNKKLVLVLVVEMQI